MASHPQAPGVEDPIALYTTIIRQPLIRPDDCCLCLDSTDSVCILVKMAVHPTGPLEDLVEVHRLAEAGHVEFFKTSARDHLRAKYGDERSGTARAVAMLLSLTFSDYEHSRHLPNPPTQADVYGIECDGDQWYIKFFTDVDLRPPHDSILKIISFHPERFTNPAMTRRRKVVLP